MTAQVDPSLRTPYALLLPTKDYHEQSAPLRPAYLTHAHRLLVALEAGLERAGELGQRRVVAVYDCGENSGVRIGHKCVRFFTVEAPTSESCAASLVPPQGSLMQNHLSPIRRIPCLISTPHPRAQTRGSKLSRHSSTARPILPSRSSPRRRITTSSCPARRSSLCHGTTTGSWGRRMEGGTGCGCWECRYDRPHTCIPPAMCGLAELASSHMSTPKATPSPRACPILPSCSPHLKPTCPRG
jgi:hypothetical protein